MEKTQWFNDKPIRVIFLAGEWRAVLNDISMALDFSTAEVYETITNEQSITEHPETGELLIDELGIYDLLLFTNLIEAQEFRMWSMKVIKKLRARVGLEGYQVFDMTHKDVQEDINDILDTLFYDDDTGMLMQSCTTYGGDVTQIPFYVEQVNDSRGCLI